MDASHYPDRVVESPCEVDPRIRCFRCEDEVYTFVVATLRRLVIVDTHSTPALALQLVEQCVGPGDTGRLLVVNTHADYDHAWGNQLFAGTEVRYEAPIVGHARCAERLTGDEGAEELARGRAREPGRFDEVVLVPPDLLVGDAGLTIDGGDLTLVLLHTPGHTDDHLSIWIPELRVVLAGDAAEHPWPHVDTPDGIAQARSSLVRLQQLDPLYVLPCHGGTTEPALLERNIDYLDAVAADAELPLEAAARIAGIEVGDLDPLYRSFHADALAASRARLSISTSKP